VSRRRNKNSLDLQLPLTSKILGTYLIMRLVHRCLNTTKSHDLMSILEAKAFSPLFGTMKAKTHDLPALVDKLAQLVSSENPLVNDVKSLIFQINDLSPSTKNLESLRKLAIFPVTLAGRPSDSPSLRAVNERFSVIDRQPLAAAFRGKIDLLDFTLEEVRKLQSFLSSFNLEGRYLSSVVTEKSSVNGEYYERSRELTVRLRNRAYALAR